MLRHAFLRLYFFLNSNSQGNILQTNFITLQVCGILHIFSSLRYRLCNETQFPFLQNIKSGGTADMLDVWLFNLNFAIMQFHEF